MQEVIVDMVAGTQGSSARGSDTNETVVGPCAIAGPALGATAVESPEIDQGAAPLAVVEIVEVNDHGYSWARLPWWNHTQSVA